MLALKEKSNLSTTNLLGLGQADKLLVKQSKIRAIENLLQDAEYDYSVLSNSEKEELFNGVFTEMPDEEITKVLV